MQMNPYLSFNGNCEAAFELYERCFGGKVSMFTYGESPMAEQTPAEWRGKIMHARLEAGDVVLMGSDSPPGYFEEPRGIHVSVISDDPAEAERVFQTLAENGEVTMPLAETFWAYRFGMLVDQFGIPWMVNCEKAA